MILLTRIADNEKNSNLKTSTFAVEIELNWKVIIRKRFEALSAQNVTITFVRILKLKLLVIFFKYTETQRINC